MMVGREVQLELEKKPPKVGEVILEVKDLVVTDDRRQVSVNGISLEVRAGEIFGIAGVQGNGQTELVEAVTGLRKSVSGSIHILGKDVTKSTPRQITELGAAHIPEDRQRDGLVLPFPIEDNLILNTYYLPPNAKGVNIQENVVDASAKALIKEYDIRTPSAMVNCGSLSGGNQQKVIIARELSRPIQLLVASQPTRGLDVGSIEYIHKQILAKRTADKAVLLVSTELDEILELSDRIGVIYRGKLVAVVPSEQATKEYIGLLMAGIKPETLEPPKAVRKATVTF
jgi:general nucleoside transport system ATP-binding protein